MAIDDGGVMRLRRTLDGVIENLGDDLGDYLDCMPAAIQEVRADTVVLSQQMFARGGSWQPVKVCRRRLPGPAATLEIGREFLVSGYFTLLKFLVGRSPAQMEQMLGFRHNRLGAGADVLVILDRLGANQFAPRGTSAWSAGASPRDLERHGARPHPDYPSASDPVYQWVIYRHCPARARKIATLEYGQPLQVARG